MWSMTKAGGSSVKKCPQPLSVWASTSAATIATISPTLPPRPFSPPSATTGTGHFVGHQPFGLRDAGEGRAVDAHAAKHALGTREGAQIFVDGRRRDRGVVDDMFAREEPVEEGAFVADDQHLWHARREWQDPPPHRSPRHRFGRVGEDLAQNHAEHHRRLDIEQASHLVRVIRRPDQRGQCAHIVRSMDDGPAAAEADRRNQRAAFLGERAGVVSVIAARLVAIAKAAHVGDQHGHPRLPQRRRDLAPGIAGR
jgi:hypothetical protein